MTTGLTHWAAMLANKNFIPWAADARELLSGKLGGGSASRDWIRNLFLVSTAGLISFERGLPVITSPRGHGKSVILARLAVRLLVEGGNDYATLRESSPFVNELAPRSITVPPAQIDALIGYDRWLLLWKCTLLAHVACMALRQKRTPDQSSDQALRLAFYVGNESASNAHELTYFQFAQQVWAESKGHVESIGPAMDVLVRQGPETEKLKEWVSKFRRVYVNVGTDVRYSIFIDAVDEALGASNHETLIKKAQRGDINYKSGKAELVWLSAQKGLLMAIREMRGEYQKIELYAAMRVEAIRSLTRKELHELGGQEIKAQSAVYAALDYTESELKEIFAINVATTGEKELVKPNDSDPVNSLFGFSRVTHRQVYGGSEDLFGLMRRHTFGSPRELVFIAKKAMECVTRDARSSSLEIILNNIDAAAETICNDWFDRVMPVFDGFLEAHDLYKSKMSANTEPKNSLPQAVTLASAALKIPCNVLPAIDIESIEAACGYTALFHKLYARGLVGYPKQTSDTKDWRLYFRPPNGEEVYLPEKFPYLALHPAFSAWIRGWQRRLQGENVKQLDFYSHLFIVGEGYFCPPNLDSPLVTLNVLVNGQFAVHLSKELLVSEVGKMSQNGLTVDLSDPEKFMPSATVERRRSAEILLVSLVLAKLRQSIDGGLEKSYFENEVNFLQNVGALTIEDCAEDGAYGHVLSQCVDSVSRDSLIDEINATFNTTKLVLKFHPKKFGSITSGTLDLCSRDSKVQHHTQWIQISARQIACRVLQVRKAV